MIRCDQRRSATGKPCLELTGDGKSMHGVAWLRPEPRRSGEAIR
nr:MAG TPA: hypothetical protein [Caudoviricetes sp.]